MRTAVPQESCPQLLLDTPSNAEAAPRSWFPASFYYADNLKFYLFVWSSKTVGNLKLSKAVHLRGANDLAFFKPTQGGPGSHTSERI